MTAGNGSNVAPSPRSNGGGVRENVVQQRVSITAMTSAMLGALSCIPGVGFLATLLGLVGLTRTKGPAKKGRWMAVVGVTLGMLGCLWTIVFALIVMKQHRVYSEVGPRADQFVRALTFGDLSEAIKVVDETRLPGSTVESVMTQLQEAGDFEKWEPDGFTSSLLQGHADDVTLRGKITFKNGKVRRLFVDMKKINQQYYVTSARVELPPTAASTPGR
jgi:hypothetical protein